MASRLYLINIFLYNVFISVAREPWEEVRLTAVTNLPELEELYLRALVKRQSNPTQENSLALTTVDIKKDLCRHIFSNAYFHMKDEDWLNTDNRNFLIELKHHHSDIFKELYQKVELRSGVAVLSLCDKCWYRENHYRYVNSYQLRTILDSSGFNGLKEHVFACLVQNRTSHHIKRYFVSQEYDLNESADESNQEYITGRFIFSDEAGTHIVFEALAEKPALAFVIGARNIERFYLYVREYRQSEINADDDPICRLSNGQKLRICSSIMNSYEYERKITFLPVLDNVRVDCEKREVSFHTNELQSRGKQSTSVFEEWMIGCDVLTVGEHAKKTFYVSRGYSRNRVFIFEECFEESIYLRHFSANVSLFDDE